MDEPDLPNGDSPDYDLFAAIARGGADSPRAKRAMAILYLRYAGDLYKLSWRYHGRLGGQPGVMDHVQEVFLRAHRAAATFVFDRRADAQTQRKATLAWLQRISTNLYIDRVRGDKQLNVALQNESYELLKDQHRPVRRVWHEDERASVPSRLQEQAVHALSTLGERDQDILLVSLDWYDRARKCFNPPSDVIAALCERYAIRPDNYRQIRDRAFKKMKDILVNAA